jgi:trigger factor
MEIKKDSVEGLKHSYQISVAAEAIEMRVKTRLLEMGKGAKIPGFRPGKAPLQILQQRYESSARPEVLRKVIDESYHKLLADKKLRPATRPQITVDNYETNQALECTYEFEVLPQIKPIDLKKAIKCERLVADVDDKMIDNALTRIAENHKTSKSLAKERPAKMGDTLIVDFDGRTEDGPISGGSGKGIQLELGSNYFIPGFEEQLVGTNKGDHKTVKVDFPQDYSAKDLQGKKATFEVTVQDIQETVIPAIDEEYAQRIGFKELKELRDAVKMQLEAENKRMSFMVTKKSILDQLDKEKVDLPQSLIDSEVHQMDPEHQYHSHNHDHDHGDEHDSCPVVKKGDSKEAEELFALAERRVRLGLILAEIGNSNNIEVTHKELQNAIIDQARRYPGQEKKVIEYFQKNPQAQQSLRAPIFEDKVMEYIIEQGNVTDKKVPLQELEAALKEITGDE